MKGLEYFIIQNLRRTFRSLIDTEGLPLHLAQHCRTTGPSIYDRCYYLEERREAHTKADELTALFINVNSTLVKLVPDNQCHFFYTAKSKI